MAENTLITTLSGWRFRKNLCIKGFNGFTLAEVLITLVIIGVIASMTIPTLMNNTNKQKYVSRLTKAYSTLKQGLNSIWQNNGVSPGDYEFLKTIDLIDELAKVVAVQNKFNTIQEFTGETISQKYRYLSGGSLTGMTDAKGIVTSDGQIITYLRYTSGALYGLSTEDSENVIGRFFVDVNGDKKPNKMGVDAYLFYLVKGKGIVPAGMEDSTTCRKNAGGQGCTAKVLKEKAINYI